MIKASCGAGVQTCESKTRQLVGSIPNLGNLLLAQVTKQSMALYSSTQHAMSVNFDEKQCNRKRES